MLAREQPLMINITTAGFNLAGPCYEHRTKALQVLNGALENERLFAVIYTIDVVPEDSTENKKGDDWAHPDALVKANPNLGVSVDKEFLLASQRSAVLNVSEQTKFKTKHLNVWCAARAAWVSLQQWQLAGDSQLEPEELRGSSCWFMFDLASKIDIAAFMILFRRRIAAMNHYYIFGKYYLPEDAIHEPSKNQLMYQKWHRQGLLTLTDGATTDFERIRDDILADAKIYQPLEIVYDPFNATHMSQLLMNEGLNLVEFTQKPQNFAVPMDEVQAALKDGRMHHDGNEMLTWMMSNVTVRPAKKGLFWPTKESPELKIDGPVAMIMGIARALSDDSDAALDQLFGSSVTA
jgi:phage terminase large subunit-like protein